MLPRAWRRRFPPRESISNPIQPNLLAGEYCWNMVGPIQHDVLQFAAGVRCACVVDAHVRRLYLHQHIGCALDEEQWSSNRLTSIRSQICEEMQPCAVSEAVFYRSWYC